MKWSLFLLWLIVIVVIIILLILSSYQVYQDRSRIDLLNNLVFPRDHELHKAKEERYLISGYLNQSPGYRFRIGAYRWGKITVLSCTLRNSQGDLIVYDSVRAYKSRNKVATIACDVNNWLNYFPSENIWEFRFDTNLITLKGTLKPEGAYVTNANNGYIEQDSILYSNLRNRVQVHLKFENQITSYTGVGSFHHQWGLFQFSRPQIYANSNILLYRAYHDRKIFMISQEQGEDQVDLSSVTSEGITCTDLSRKEMLDLIQNSKLDLIE